MIEMMAFRIALGFVRGLGLDGVWCGFFSPLNL